MSFTLVSLKYCALFSELKPLSFLKKVLPLTFHEHWPCLTVQSEFSSQSLTTGHLSAKLTCPDLR